MKLYNNLPDPPNDIDAANVLVRLLDALGFRYQIATNGLTETECLFRPCEGSFSISEVNLHIYNLCFWIEKSLNKQAIKANHLDTFRNVVTAVLESVIRSKSMIKEMSPTQLDEFKLMLKRMNKEYSFWYLINGPITDAISHVGQILTWRRQAGNPVERISPFTGEVF